jgi:hypothetical protein
LDRPAIVPEIAAGAAALLVSYGSSAHAFADVVFGLASPQGRLPFDLPSSTRSVEESRSDVPFDTANPLFRFGDGTRFRGPAGLHAAPRTGRPTAWTTARDREQGPTPWQGWFMGYLHESLMRLLLSPDSVAMLQVLVSV